MVDINGKVKSVVTGRNSHEIISGKSQSSQSWFSALIAIKCCLQPRLYSLAFSYRLPLPTTKPSGQQSVDASAKVNPPADIEATDDQP